jgi:hypothetical protein
MEATEILNQANEQGLKIVFTEDRIASRSGDTIFLNENILRYPEFCRKTMAHELSHSHDYTAKDIMMDLTEPSIFDSLIFCWHHPKGFYQFIPFEIRDEIIYLDATLLGVYILLIGIIGLFVIFL